MKLHGVKREFANPFFVLKKHKCLYCGERLRKIKIEIIVNSESLEAIHYDFSTSDGFLKGNIKFIRTGFQCLNCNKLYTVKELKEQD